MEAGIGSEEIANAFLRKIENCNADEALNCAIKHLQRFVGANFAGIQVPSLEEHLILANENKEFSPEHLRELAFQQLSFGTNRPFIGARQIEHLWLAKMFFDSIRPEKEATRQLLLWKYRFFSTWSTVLADREIELGQQMDQLANSLHKIANDTDNFHIEFLLERAQTHMYFFQYSAAKNTIDEALRLAGIKRLELGGALGKRTQFQQKSVAQLTLQLEIAEDIHTSTTGERIQPNNTIPHDCKSGDDTLLEQVQFDQNSSNGRQLNALQTACILTMAFWEQRANPSVRELGNELPLVYLEEVIRQRSGWALQARALVERSKLEMHNSRRVERASAQLEQIAQSLDFHTGNEDEFAQRFQMLFASWPLPFWEVSKLQAKVLVSLGCFSDALHIFERLQLWDEMVNCHLGIGQPEKAESLIRRLLAEKEDSVYYCLLGDISNNIDHYMRAIEISGDTSARARASLGKLMSARKEFAEAARHCERSLEIRPLQLGIWYHFGYCSLKAGDYKKAIHAFHRCVSIEPEHFEAWNNLAAAYIRDNQTVRAQKILQEALRLNWENAHVWENFLLVSLDIGDFKQAVNAMEKLMDLDQKRPLDELPLEIICIELLRPLPEDNNLCGLKQRLLAILARANSRQSLSPKLLRLYAQLKRPTTGTEDGIAWSVFVQLLERAYQKDFEQITSSKSHEKYAKLFEYLLEFATELHSLWKIQKLEQQQIKMELQLRLRPAITFVEREFGPNCEQSQDEVLIQLYRKTKLLLS